MYMIIQTLLVLEFILNILLYIFMSRRLSTSLTYWFMST